ncbi:MAG: cell division protein FtsL [Gammaproteobacteria bacterium]|jgi:cell division protein FtsL|nr:cell division protein FtsL [Candidatus Thioaporhodococcus sediminis]TNF55686.1 MAG: cell division protein FtsL [Gammaproteobacteria bacterium]
MTLRDLFLVALLALAVIASGVGVVYAKYQTRIEFIQLQALTRQLQGLEEEWGVLRLEEAALATHPRVEMAARTRLEMLMPRGVDIRTIGGKGHER